MRFAKYLGMSNSLQAQLTLVYKRFQAYTDLIGYDKMRGLDDQFIEAYDQMDIASAKSVLTEISDLYHEYLDGKPFTVIE